MLAHGLGLLGLAQLWQAGPASVAALPALRASFHAPVPPLFPDASVNASPGTRQAEGGSPRSRPQGNKPLSAAAPAKQEPTHMPAVDMAERARAELRDRWRQEWLDPMHAGPAAPSRQSDAFERATSRPAPGVEQLSGRLVRITLADGRRYCLHALPETAQRGGPLAPMAVPMNCP